MQATLVGRVLSGYGGVGASFRAEAGRISEARLLLYAMLGCALVFAARLPALMQALPGGVAVGDFIGAQVVGHVFFGPLMLYGLAAVSRLGARAAGGQGGWQPARLALFWALLLAAPPILLVETALTAAGLTGSAAARPLSLGPWLLYLWFWAVCLAEAEGFRRTALVFACLAAVPLAVAALFGLAALSG